ncbi:C39 family peptidase [Candidatus Woesebacteria bacterium]|nr:C39 family peptidase [Candidatus Woesebacteria bacterium]
MAEILREFNNLKTKDKKNKKELLTIGMTFIILVLFSFFLHVYKDNQIVRLNYSNFEKIVDLTSSNFQSSAITSSPIPLYGVIPESYQIKGGSHSFQTFNNCGPASLSMALSFYCINVSQKALGDELRPYQIPNGDNDDKSVTLAELAEKSKDFGFIPFHRPVGTIEIVKKFVANNIPVITRTLTKTNEDIGHFRVVYGYNDKRGYLIQNDSLQGKGLKYDYDEFLQLWKPYGFEYLVLVKPGQEKLVGSIIGENIDEMIAWQNAVEYLKKEAVKNPEDKYLQFSLSVAYYEIGDCQKSIEIFEKVESKLPFRTLWYQIEPLLAYQKLGRYVELLPRIENILNNGNRAFSEFYQIRGEIYLKQGRIEAARQEFEKAIYYNKNFQPAQLSLEHL